MVSLKEKPRMMIYIYIYVYIVLHEQDGGLLAFCNLQATQEQLSLIQQSDPFARQLQKLIRDPFQALFFATAEVAFRNSEKDSKHRCPFENR